MGSCVRWITYVDSTSEIESLAINLTNPSGWTELVGKSCSGLQGTASDLFSTSTENEGLLNRLDEAVDFVSPGRSDGRSEGVWSQLTS